MKLIVGLGNPGKKYTHTRHNLGFIVIDKYVAGLKTVWGNKFEADVALVSHPVHDKIIFLKPQTFMNLSGHSVVQFVRFYKIISADLLVIHDDLDLPLGRIRFAAKGSAGGHNGVKSIITSLGTKDFHHLKLGIGRPLIPDLSVTDYVLQGFSKQETFQVKSVTERAVVALGDYISMELDMVMNTFNGEEMGQ